MVTISGLYRYLCQKKRHKKLGFKRFAELDEIITILNSFEMPKEWHYWLIFRILAFTNLRPKEACYLKLDNFVKDFTKANVYQTKTDEFKEVLVPSFLIGPLRDYIHFNISEIIKHDGHLFYTDNNKSKHKVLQPSTLRWRMVQIRRKYNLLDHIVKKKRHYRIGVYSLRRFFITTLSNMPSVNIQDVCDIVGHSNPRITMGYRKPRPDSFKHELLNKAFESVVNQRCGHPEQELITKFI